MPDSLVRGARIRIDEVFHRYGAVLAINGVSLTIEEGSFTTVLGPNGAGKSTLAKILCGVLDASSGRLEIDGTVARTSSGTGLVRQGIVLVPEGRRLFGQLSCRENLLAGAYGAGISRRDAEARLMETLALMPSAIRAGQSRAAATFSGGEQQMLALGRAMMARPRAIIMDEPSLGLAPILIDRVYGVLKELNAKGVTVIVIEQLAVHAMRYATSMTLLDRGTISYSGPGSGELAAAALQRGYLGHGSPDIQA